MKWSTYRLELLTPTFISGADQSRAEIRIPSIRGQLRWWFRLLGGFRSLGDDWREQEAMIFGSAAGKGRAGLLAVRLAEPVVSSETRDAEQMGVPINSNRGYLLFNLRSRKDRRTGQVTQYGGRGVLQPRIPFAIQTSWRGDSQHTDDLHALFSVFAHLGALGSRSRRAMGALAPISPVEGLRQALTRFRHPRGVEVFELYSERSSDPVEALGGWLKSWRSHGRTQDHRRSRPPAPPHNPGFRYVRQDHDRGRDVLQATGSEGEVTFRSAIGLPIVQFFSSSKETVNWGTEPPSSGKVKGRFASPVLLRPHRGRDGKIHALVIFVDAHKWREGAPVYLNGERRQVSLELYEAMKKDPKLRPFSG